jgi:hypothetical protein
MPRWENHVARMDKIRNAYNIFIRKSEVRDHSEDLGVDRKIILELVLGK